MSSGLKLKSISTAENEFLAESERIQIIPNFDHDSLKFLCGNYGPFEASIPCFVPIWLAITLRKKGKCQIVAPEWLTVEQLQIHIDRELSQQELTELPYHYLEIATLVLLHAKDDINFPDKISALLKDLENIRMDRIRNNFLKVGGIYFKGEEISNIRIKNISAMEILSVKGFLLESLNLLKQLSPKEVSVSTRNTSNRLGGSTSVDGESRQTLRRFQRP
jgi:GINS complex subunit 2